MKRSKKIVLVSHCLLNQNARAQQVAKCPGVVKEFLEYCLKNDYGLVPITCPQLQFEPLVRRAATKEHYNKQKVRTICRNISKQVVKQIKMYHQAGYQVAGIFGVEGSPTCGAIKTHILNSRGQSQSVKQSGVFIEELKKVLQKNQIKVKIFDWDIQAKKPISK
ncbi:DUF523 domain-containing protein [Patescibacteria group bacterium]|nr:DUF523 domain-containing protein [Patescibacteria group bacterium]